MSLNPAQMGGRIQHYVIKFVSDSWQVGDFPGTPVSSTNKTDSHNITEIVLKVALNTITQTPILKLHIQNVYTSHVFQFI